MNTAKKPRATVPDWALASEQVGGRLLVWDEELDDTREGELIAYNESYPLYTIRLFATEWESETIIYTMQGPYTENGRYRVVEVLTRSLGQLHPSSGVAP